jgi:hypothetical protein
MSESFGRLTAAPYAHLCDTCAGFLSSQGLQPLPTAQAAYQNGRHSPYPRCQHPGTHCDRCLRPSPSTKGKRCEGCGQVVTP